MKVRQAVRPIFSEDQWIKLMSDLMLSPRQGQIVKRVILGHSDDSISRGLGITKSTLRSHLTEIRYRLNADNRVQICYRIFEAYLESENQEARTKRQGADRSW